MSLIVHHLKIPTCEEKLNFAGQINQNRKYAINDVGELG